MTAILHHHLALLCFIFSQISILCVTNAHHCGIFLYNHDNTGALACRCDNRLFAVPAANTIRSGNVFIYLFAALTGRNGVVLHNFSWFLSTNTC